MSIYNNKHCVFEMVGVDADTIQWNQKTNKDVDNCINDYNISDMRNTHLPARLLLLSNILQSELTNTTIQTATNGINGTLVSTSDKLFIAAEKEMTGTRQYSRTEEFNALTTWTYWTTHTTNSDRVKKDPSNNVKIYKLRSPYSDSTDYVVFVHVNGTISGGSAEYKACVSPCFAF